MSLAPPQGLKQPGHFAPQGAAIGPWPPQGNPGAAAAFSPSDISGLMLWLKSDGLKWQDSARTTPATADTNPVGAWDDYSGNSSHATQATAGLRPILKTAALNSKDVVQFDGTDDVLVVPNVLSALTAAEVFVVVQVDLDPALSAAATGFWQFGTDANPTHLCYTDGKIYDDFGSTARSDTGDPTPSFQTTYRLYNVVTTSAEWTSFIDGTQQFTTGTNTVGFTTAPLLGGDARSTDFYLAGRIAEVVIYNAKLSAGNKTSVKSYFAGKFGLTIA